jgi:hypothetical protein
MARTITKKKNTVRVSRRASGYALMPTDHWNKAKHFVHYEIESKDWLSKIKEYIKNHCDRKTIAEINLLPDWKICGGSHWAAAAALLEQNPEAVPEAYRTGIEKFVQNLAEQGRKLAEERAVESKTDKTATVPNIQDRINEQVNRACDAIEQWLDGFVVDRKSFDPDGFDFTAHFSNMSITQAHARKIAARYADELAEARLIANRPTPAAIAKIRDHQQRDFAEQLREGYQHIDKKSAQLYLAALEKLAGACELVIDSSRAARKPRAKKAPSKEKLIAKVKYQKTDEKLQIASVNPIELLEATEIWVYNTKTRKLGRYVAAEDCQVMTVKGSVLIGFDSAKSIQKTLRKPADTLKEFKASGKIKLRRFLDQIKTTETQLSGRLTVETVILRTAH